MRSSKRSSQGSAETILRCAILIAFCLVALGVGKTTKNLEFTCESVKGAMLNAVRCENDETVCYGRDNYGEALSCLKK